MNNVWLAFITGLTTGGISCMAVQGGLLTSSIDTQKETKGGQTRVFVAMFLVAKITAYTILGALLGLLGSALTPSPKFLAIFQLLIGFFLLGTVGRLLDLHPIFRYFAIQPPKFVFRLAKKHSQKAQLFTPVFLGALTVLMPCGVTQAMMLVALGTGSVLSASLVMFAFVLGTSPVFFMIGVTALQLLKKKAFAYISSLVVFILAIVAINNAMGLLGSVHTLQNYWSVISGRDNRATNTISANYNKGVQEATITVTGRGYTSDVTTLKVGVPVKLRLVTNNVYSCARAFTIPSLNISRILPSTGEEVLEFTPTKTGRLAYSCSMGMYTGSFNVVE
jgi:sulfite exporter TauE/SafE